MDKIEKALRRLENAEPRVTIRGGKICRIPVQEVKLQPKDGVQITYSILEDITDEE